MLSESYGSDEEFSRLKRLAVRHGKAVEVVDKELQQQGAPFELLIENHLITALVHVSEGKIDFRSFLRLREVIDDLERGMSSSH